MSRALLLLVVGFVAGHAFGVGWRMPDVPVVIWGNEHYVLIRTTPSQTHRVLELASKYCGSLTDSTNPGHNKSPLPTDVPIEAMREPGFMRFDCISHRQLTGPMSPTRSGARW